METNLEFERGRSKKKNPMNSKKPPAKISNFPPQIPFSVGLPNGESSQSSQPRYVLRSNSPKVVDSDGFHPLTPHENLSDEASNKQPLPSEAVIGGSNIVGDDRDSGDSRGNVAVNQPQHHHVPPSTTKGGNNIETPGLVVEDNEQGVDNTAKVEAHMWQNRFGREVGVQAIPTSKSVDSIGQQSQQSGSQFSPNLILDENNLNDNGSDRNANTTNNVIGQKQHNGSSSLSSAKQDGTNTKENKVASCDPILLPVHAKSNSNFEHEPTTFAALFKEVANIAKKGTLRFIAPIVAEKGTKLANIPDTLVLKQAENWSTTLIGYFVGKRPVFSFVKFHATRLWKKFGLEDVILNEQGYFYFKFQSDQGMKFVMENGPWLFNDFPIFLRTWQPDMWFDKPKPTKVPMWVNIYDMPVSLWDYDILSHLVSVIGIPIAVDRYTAEMCENKTGRAVFARVLVEISADGEIPGFVEAKILGTVRKFRLEYNWTPARCSHCKIFGHNFIDCTDRPKSSDEMEPHVKNGVECSERPKDQDFQQPKKRRRRPKKAQTTSSIYITTNKPKVSKVTQTEKSKSDSEAIDNNQTSDTSIPVTIPSMDAVVPDTHPGTHDPSHQYNANTSSPAAEKDMMKENESFVGTDSSVVPPSTPLATEDFSNPNHATESCNSFSWLDYVGPSTNEEPNSEYIWCYRDPTGKSHGPFTIEQLHKWSDYLPIDLKIWKSSCTEKESIHLHSALKRRTTGLNYSNVG